jgi:hypothetical protein
VAAVGSADGLLDAVDRLHPDGVLTDIQMLPGHDLKESRPRRSAEIAGGSRGSIAACRPDLRISTSEDGWRARLLKERVGDTDISACASRKVASRSVIDLVVEARYLHAQEGAFSARSPHARETDVLRDGSGKTTQRS